MPTLYGLSALSPYFVFQLSCVSPIGFLGLSTGTKQSKLNSNSVNDPRAETNFFFFNTIYLDSIKHEFWLVLDKGRVLLSSIRIERRKIVKFDFQSIIFPSL